MRKTKKILAILLMLSLIIGGLTFVNAATDASKALTISDGVREGNKITFKVNLPEGTALRGDVNLDGVIDSTDKIALEKYLQDSVKNHLLNDVAMKAADFNMDGEITGEDEDGIVDYINQTIKIPELKLTGDLASSATAQLIKESTDNKLVCSIEVTLPENTTKGTIGVTINDGVLMYESGQANKATSSKLFDIKNITISDGVKDGNKVTFKINLPEGTVLRGDVDLNGKIEKNDSTLITAYLLSQTKNPLTELQKKAADADVDGIVNSRDEMAINNIVDKIIDYKPIKLDGTLAKNSNYELVIDADGNYSVKVTIPEDSKEGTIGVTLLDKAFMFDMGSPSEATSSELFDLAKLVDNEEFKVVDEKQDKTDDGKIKVTLIVNKELDKDKIPEGWTVSEDAKSISKIMEKGETKELTLVAKDGSTLKHTVIAGSKLEAEKDETTANTKIPQTGVKNTVLVVIAGIAIVGTVVFIRSRKMLK